MPEIPLNQAQRQAVEHDRGPVVVLAGPGTGKTRVIVHRIEHMIAARAIAPESILAVTYTVKAAGELRERLAALVGPGNADRLNIHTFHGFGLRLIRRFADLVGLPGDLHLVDPAQRRRLARALIAEHRLFPDRAAEGRDRLAGRFEDHLELFANNAILPARARAAAQAWSARAESNPAGLEGDALLAERARARDFADIARLYELYETECRRRGWISYGDLLLIPLDLLARHATAAAYCRQDFRHIVVDEFQDANTAQIELLRLLAPPASDPDLCVVGDDDQSIYEFRGADDLAFHRFARVWPAHRRIDLTENYRSETCIITAANAVIGRAAFRFAPDKQVIRALNSPPALPTARVEAVHLEDDKLDGDVIAALIRADRAQAPPRPWSDYAVIARSHIDLERVAAALELEGIPCVRQRRGSAADEPGVQDITAWIRLLVDPSDAHAAQRLLMRPPCRIPPGAAGELLSSYRSRVGRARLAAEPSEPPAVADWLNASVPGNDARRAVIDLFAARFQTLRDIAASQPADETIYRIITLTGVAEADLLPARERARRVASLVWLLRFARERQDRLDPPGDLAAFWSYFNDLDDKSRERLGEEQSIEHAETPETADAVRLLTAHASKGLEFDTVFLPRVSPQFGYPSTRSRDDGCDVPPELIDRDGDIRDPRDRQLAEERRVFYVACTRAKRRLILLAKKNKKPSSSTHFLEEFILDPASAALLTLREQADTLAECARLAGPGPAHGQLEKEAPDLAARATREELIARARRAARLDAATALDAAETTPGIDLAAIADRLRESAERLHAVAAVERTGRPPAGAAGPAADFAARLADSIAKGASKPGASVGEALAPPPAPLELSFTAISDYEDCPRCFYLKHILRLADREGAAGQIGSIVHKVLATFAGAWRDADAVGATPPHPDTLERLGRDTYLREVRGHPDAEELDQILALLRSFATTFHDPAAHILELEKLFRVPYECDGRAHTLIAKIDRVDQAGPGRFRIIDYKTGADRKGLLEPEEKDLQMGIYAMAWARHLAAEGDDAGPAPQGVAEYWLLASRSRGSIGLDRLDMKKVRARIDKAIRGILAGEFEPKCKGDGDCAFLGPA
ncbi:MAG: ATP-dependent helicase [Phycisphaerales bacterium]|nr:ATP-dependent helicase [Phycisphaerales bacterium]